MADVDAARPEAGAARPWSSTAAVPAGLSWPFRLEGFSVAGSVTYRCPPNLLPNHPRLSPGAATVRKPPVTARARILPQELADAASRLLAGNKFFRRGSEPRWSRRSVQRPEFDRRVYWPRTCSPCVLQSWLHSSQPRSVGELYKCIGNVASRFFRQRRVTVIDCDACESAASFTGFFARVFAEGRLWLRG